MKASPRLWPHFGRSNEYGADVAAYARWREQAGWRRQARLFGVPIVNRDFKDSMEYAGNVYGKAGLVLEMLREQMGDAAFFSRAAALPRNESAENGGYADLERALEDTTHQHLDVFFKQWIYGGGAPQFAVTSSYDAEPRS